MLLKVTDNKKISEIQDKFNECFPYLKIEFYQEPHAWKQGSKSSDCYHENERIGNIRKFHQPEILDIKSWFRTGDVEQTFREKLDLNVQIFRMDGDRWVQSTESDSLTLKEQSEIAAASVRKKMSEQADYDEVYQ